LTVIGHRQFPHGPGTAQAAPVSCRRQRQHLAGLGVMQHGRPGQWDDYRDRSSCGCASSGSRRST